ncbi:MAG: phosphopentomutase, partial [Clostridia bacterium]|nr:phosphopentomutase [Clostridia bacterium]
MKNRAIVIVLDSVGMGYLPDANEFNDIGAHTIGHVYEHSGMKIPNMVSLGIGNIEDSRLPRVRFPRAAYGRSLELTKAKDTTCGHWEIAGFPMEEPFRTYPNGFPKNVIEAFETKIGRKVLGNEVASGTEIIQRLGDEHVRTGYPIVYTSADSVFQIAAHEDVIPL